MKEVAIIHKTEKPSSFVYALSSNPMSVQYAPTPTEGIYELLQLSIVTNSDDTTEDDVSGLTVLLQLQPNGYDVNSELLILEQKKCQHY